MSTRPDFSAFNTLFNRIAGHRHRHEVFRDFVTITAISLHNAIRKTATLENEYLTIVRGYDQETVRETFPKLFAELVVLLDAVPTDILGQLFIQLELGNERTGQFFTPPEISFLMANMTIGDEIEQRIAENGFVTVNEPACGAGGMVLALARAFIERKYDPSSVMWVCCQDVDRAVAMMCYVQMALWNIPGVVIVGNTLANEAREAFYTPAHWLGFWEVKLRRHREQTVTNAGSSSTDTKPDANVASIHAESSIAFTVPSALSSSQASNLATQLGFDFDL